MSKDQQENIGNSDVESVEEITEEDLEWEEWNPAKISFVNHMIAGSAAGLAEHISIFPIDTVKTYVQCEKCGSSSIFKTWNCVSRMVHNEGPFRLWRGVSAMFAGCIPGINIFYMRHYISLLLTKSIIIPINSSCSIL
jgi:hypothetical protein